MSRHMTDTEARKPYRPGREWVGHIQGLPLETAQDILDPGAEEFERARRVLIYRDMVTRTGRVQYRLLATWMYQPSEGEVMATITDMRLKKQIENVRKRPSAA